MVLKFYLNGQTCNVLKLTKKWAYLMGRDDRPFRIPRSMFNWEHTS